MKVLQIDQQGSPTKYEGYTNKLIRQFKKYECITNQQINIKYKGIANTLAIKTFK